MGERTIYQARLSILKVIATVDRKARLSANQREKLLSLVEASLTIPLRDVETCGLMRLRSKKHLIEPHKKS